MNTTQYNTLKAVQIIERDIDFGSIKTVKQLLARTGKASLSYSAYYKLLKKMKAKQASKVPMFLRKQAF
jgi:replication-associated recombination protein RarA